jgi:peptidoglycan/LPS O-acetylase OafA/YrhL
MATAIVVVTYATPAFLVALPLAGGYLVLYLAIARWLPAQGFGRYGDFSYGLYVFAFPIQQAIVHFAGTGMSLTTFFVAAFASTLVVAVASWHLVEAPALALKPYPTHQSASLAALPAVPAAAR